MQVSAGSRLSGPSEVAPGTTRLTLKLCGAAHEREGPGLQFLGRSLIEKLGVRPGARMHSATRPPAHFSILSSGIAFLGNRGAESACRAASRASWTAGS